MFLNVIIGDWQNDMQMAVDIAKRLGPEFITVRPDQLAMLYEKFRKAT